MDITEEYEDVLQNLELPIYEAYKLNPLLEDWSVKRSLEACIEHYRAEYAQRKQRDQHLSEEELALAAALVQVCEGRLGRVADPLWGASDNPDFIKTPDELQKCLKRIIKSVERWNRVRGKQGYLEFMSQFL